MKRFSFLLTLLSLFLIGDGVWGQGSESFTDIPTNSSGSYNPRTWTGDDGGSWEATNARTDQTINGRAICTSGNGKVTSPTYNGGMGILAFNYVRAFTGTSSRKIEVWINGSQFGSEITVSPTSNTVVSYSSTVDISGSVQLELRTSGNQIKIDDISWTAYTGSSCTEPTTQATTASFSSITNNSMNLSWTFGNGTAGRIVVMKEASAVSGSPTSGTAYTANSTFGSGDEIATDEFVVYNGTGSSVTVAGLDCGKTYHASVFEYNTTDVCYNVTSPATANETTTLTITPTLPSSTQSCGSTEFAATANSGTESTYWQTSASGTSTADPANVTKTVSASTIIYLRTFSSSANCWSAPLTVTPTVSENPVISTHPVDQSDVVGQNITFSVTATNANSYQWQVSADNGGSWSNISSETTASITLSSVTLAMDGNQYRVIVGGNSPCSSVTSSAGTLSVITGPCHEEDFSNIPSSNSGYTTRTWAGAGGSWTALNSRTDQSINGNTITFEDGPNAYLTSHTFTDGIGNITLTTQRKFGGGSGVLTIEVNGSSVGTIPYGASVQTSTITGINISGNVTIVIDNASGNDRVAIDDMNWTCYSATPEPEINLTGNNTSIPSGNTTTSLTDHTDFGSTSVSGGTVARTFTIENSGAADLSITNVSSSNSSEFAISAISIPTTIAASNSTTFVVTFDPSALGSRTATITVANNDADEGTYTFVVEGTGVNSSNSDIVSLGTFMYSSNIDYTAYQGNPVSTTSNGVASFGFLIRDGGASSDADNLGTELTAISFTTSNIANVRSAALFDGSTFIANSSSISGGAINFTGLSGSNVTASDNGVKVLTLYVSFNTVVTDNQQLQYTVSSAIANSSGSVFATANAGGATSSTTGDVNRIEVVASAIQFSQQATSTDVNGTMSPSPQISAVDVDGNTDLDYTSAIQITSSGTMTGAPLSSNAVAGVATFSSVIHSVAGTGFTLTASSSGFTNVASSAFDITTFQYSNGDVRPLYNGAGLSYNSAWEEYSSGVWSTRSQSPESLKPTGRIIIDKLNIDGSGNVLNSYNDIIITDGGSLILNDNTGTLVDFINAGKTLEIQDGGRLELNGQIQLNSSANLIVRSGGILELNNDVIDNTHPLWKGTENFEQGSYVIISNWNWTVGSAGNKSLLSNGSSQISNNTGGYKFGNLSIEAELLDDWTLISGSTSPLVPLCEDNFEIFNTSPTFFISGTSNNYSGFIINGDLIIYDGWFNFGTKFSGTNGFSNNYVVRGDFICLSDDKLKLHEIYLGATTSTGSLTVHGNFEIGNQVPNFTNHGTKKIILKGGTAGSSKYIDVATSVLYIPIEIEDGYRVLRNNDLEFGNNSSMLVNSGASLNFGFNSSGDALNIISTGTGSGNSFIAQAQSTLYLTSPGGITSSGATGNVQTNSRTFSTSSPYGDYHYIGKASQNTGTALPENIRNLTNNNDVSANNLTLSKNYTVTNTLTMLNGNIQTGINLLELGQSTSIKGTLSHTSGYVVGKMRRWFNGTNTGNSSGLFPMGFEDSGLKNRNVKVEYTSAPTGGHLTVEFIGTPMGAAGIPIATSNSGGAGFDVLTTEDQGYWKIDNETGKLIDGSYTISLTGEGFTTITDLSKLTLLKRVGTGSWMCPGTHIATAPTSFALPLVSRSGVSGWSNFGFGGGAGNTLPVTLTSFEVDCSENENRININWSTASETNSSHFTVEKSRDMVNWRTVANTQAAGNSNYYIDYSEVDENPSNGITYYRLSQLDFDGKMEVFDAVSVSCGMSENNINAYPNPSNGEFTLEIVWTENSVQTEMQLLDMTGRVILTQDIKLEKGVKQLYINETYLQKGTYLIVFPNTELKPIRVLIDN